MSILQLALVATLWIQPLCQAHVAGGDLEAVPASSLFFVTRLSNNQTLPWVGLGVGNARRQYVGALVAEALQDDKHIRLIDTAHASRNEHLLAEGIVMGADRRRRRRRWQPLQTQPSAAAGGAVEDAEDGRLEVHVVTKVWYTHLGYERTRLSVQESLKALQPALQSDQVNLKIHIMLHWPRCYDTIAWMKCEEEQAKLRDEVKQAGPDPTLNPEHAWKGSWKYLEELYLSQQYPIASIGVSNFGLADMEAFDEFARIQPHLVQMSLWSAVYDTMLVDYCQRHDIHIQVYNGMSAVPQLQESLMAVAATEEDAMTVAEAKTVADLSAGQVMLAWLIQKGYSVIPRTSKLTRLEENAAITLAHKIPLLTSTQSQAVVQALNTHFRMTHGSKKGTKVQTEKQGSRKDSGAARHWWIPEMTASPVVTSWILSAVVVVILTWLLVGTPITTTSSSLFKQLSSYAASAFRKEEPVKGKNHSHQHHHNHTRSKHGKKQRHHQQTNHQHATTTTTTINKKHQWVQALWFTTALLSKAATAASYFKSHHHHQHDEHGGFDHHHKNE